MVDPGAGQADLVGVRVGNYQVVSLLGQGGMGEVYLARHPELGREVAVKVLGGALAADATAIGRFRQEALAACRIGHQAIVEVLDIGTLPDGRHYYVMERLVGESLREHLEARGPLSPAETGEIARPVIDALTAAHAAGIVHRDLKPDNIYLVQTPGEPPQVKVLDFGVAKLVDATLSPLVATRSGALIGTPLYMSPEQAAGTGKQVGPASDVYGLGAVLFHMLAGRPPFLGEGVGEVLVQHMQSPPPSLRDHRPELSPTLDRVVAQALAKAPAGRFDTMQALGAALEQALASPGATPEIGGAATVLATDAGAASSLNATELLTSGTAASPSTAAPVSPSALSQSSLSEAASEQITAAAAPPTRASNRGLVIGVIVGLLIGAGAVTVGVMLGRSSDRSAEPAPGHTATTVPAAKARNAGPPTAPDAATMRPPRRPTAPAAKPREAPPTTAPRVRPAARPRMATPPMKRPRARPRPSPRIRPRDKGRPKASALQVKIASRWLRNAEQSERQGSYQQARSLAKMAYRYLRAAKAVRIVGFSACRVRSVRDAKWADARLAGATRSRLRALCKKRGITLP